MVSRSLVVAALMASAFAANAFAKPIHIAKGEIQGTREDGLTVYRGVPFAAAPIGELRWRAPQPPAHWAGVRAAEKFAPPCIGNGPGSSEDCLYLNVWTPAQSADERLPVMVWIYGGGFAFGATSTPLYSGERLAKKGVVFVSVAYRVGPLGFLAHPALSAETAQKTSGNYGLLDQIAALKWVRENIHAFGGDPDKVTIFGESAGGISVSILAASPLAKGLFRGAISESGGSFGPTRAKTFPGENLFTLANAEAAGAAFAQKLGAADAKALRALSPEQIAAAARGGEGLGWPILDRWLTPDDQYRLYEQGAFNDTPILIGINSDEGATFVPGATPLAVYQTQTRQRFGPFAEKILAAYAADTDEAAKQAARDLSRDAAFGWHNWAWARLQARAGKSNVFYYVFDQRPPYPPTSRAADAQGAPHASELAFVFGHLDQQPLSWREEDRAISDAMATYWTNFVKTGDPNGAGVPEWPAFTNDRQSVMHFKHRPTAGGVPNPAQLEALDAYFAWRRTPEGAQ
jgi:para-nitrobenzyl esterase